MIIAKNITKYYGAKAAIKDLSFDINEGEIVGLLGLNGAGKTTTLRILSGQLLPTSGTATIAGIDLTVDPEAARAKIGFLPEEPPLYPEMTVEDFLIFVARINGLNSNLDLAINNTLEATDLLEKRQSRICTLSQGY